MTHSDSSGPYRDEIREDYLIKKELDAFNKVMEQVAGKGDRKAISLWVFTTAGLKQYNLDGQYDAAYVINEAYVRGVNAINKGYSITNHLAWLRQTGRNVTKELSRQRKRECPGMDMDSFPEDNSDAEVWGETPVRAAEYARMHQAFEALTPTDQRILHLKVVKAMKWKDIASVLNAEGHRRVTVEGLRQQKSRALKKLRQNFQQSL